MALRAVEEEDAEFLQQLVHDPDIRVSLGRTPEPVSVSEEQQKIKEIHQNDSIIQFIIEKNGEKAGTIALFHIDRDYRKAEFGAFMVDPEKHGEGIGTTALKLLLDYAFDELNFHRIEGGYIEGNDASRRVQEKLGFSEEGRQRDAKYRDGEYLDIIRMSILEQEWRSS